MLRKPGTRKRGAGVRGPSRKRISYNQIRSALPPSMRSANNRLMKKAILGLRCLWNNPWKEKNKPITDDQFVSYCLSQYYQGW